MIISRTPFRVSFFGGGTDYPAWYLEEGGAVLSTTIDKYCYLTCRYLPPFFGIKHRIVWRHVETVESISDILHPAVRECLRFLEFDDRLGLEIHYQGDLPARSGMGSSSAFAVGLIRVLTALRGQMLTKHDLAMKAVELEQSVLRENVGSQDQVAAAHGGLNVIRFLPSGVISVEPVTVPPWRVEELESNLLLVYTGSSRHASEVATQFVANMQRKRDALRRMKAMVDEGVAILAGGGDIADFGRLLHEGWMLKRELSPMVSNVLVDSIYQTALAHGAVGGKLLGAGSSGFMALFTPVERQAEVLDSLNGFLQVPFRFEREGSMLIYYEPERQDLRVLVGTVRHGRDVPRPNGHAHPLVPC